MTSSRMTSKRPVRAARKSPDRVTFALDVVALRHESIGERHHEAGLVLDEEYSTRHECLVSLECLRVRRLQLTGNGARPLIGLGRWQCNRERTAGAGPGRHGDPAAVCCDDLSDEREAEPVAVDLTGDGISAPVERVEDVGQFGCRDSVAVIAYRDPHLRTTALPAMLDLDANPSVVAAVLGCVCDQVLHCRPQCRRITDDRPAGSP